jgi:hypothetical protein
MQATPSYNAARLDIGYRCNAKIPYPVCSRYFHSREGRFWPVNQGCRSTGCCILTLAWHADHGTGKRVQLPFPG